MKLPFITEHVVGAEIRIISGARRRSRLERFEASIPTWALALARAAACFTVLFAPPLVAVACFRSLGVTAGLLAANVIAFAWIYVAAYRSTWQGRLRSMATGRVFRSVGSGRAAVARSKDVA